MVARTKLADERAAYEAKILQAHLKALVQLQNKLTRQEKIEAERQRKAELGGRWAKALAGLPRPLEARVRQIRRKSPGSVPLFAVESWALIYRGRNPDLDTGWAWLRDQGLLGEQKNAKGEGRKD